VPPPPMSVAETLATPGVLLWAIMLVGVLAALGLAAVHIVPIHERLVVIRLGRCHRVRGPGPVLIIPGLERAVAMSVVPDRHPRRRQNLGRTRSPGPQPGQDRRNDQLKPAREKPRPMAATSPTGQFRGQPRFRSK
jgi:hypothetical protein